MKNKNVPSKAREILWLAVALLSFFTAVHKTVNQDFKSGIQFWVFMLVSLLLYYIRRNLRIKEENEEI